MASRAQRRAKAKATRKACEKSRLEAYLSQWQSTFKPQPDMSRIERKAWRSVKSSSETLKDSMPRAKPTRAITVSYR